MRSTADWPTRDPLTHRRETSPERTAVIDVESDERWSYREFDRRVDRLASALESALETPRLESSDDTGASSDRVAVLMETRPAFASLVFAAMRTGRVLVPLNVRETPSELASKLERTDPDAVICEAETESLAASSTDRPIFSVDRPSDSTPEPVGSLSQEDGGAAAAPDPVSLERDDPFLIMFTSGTSGEPKGVRLTVGNLLASATASAFRLGVLPSDRWLCCLPMYHMGGLAPVVRSALYGTALVVQRDFDPVETARVVEEYDVTGVSLVPTMLTRMLEAGWREPDSLRFVLLGGAPASNELLERARGAGVPAYPTYGMTEAASQISTATPEQARSHEGTVGQPLVVTDVTVVGDDGTPLAPGESGEIVVSGPTVTPGYLEAGHTDAAFGAHGLHTGDIGYRDREGRLWVLNRRSDRIVTGGENVDPGEVVDVLRAHPQVDETAVVGLSDPEWGERVGALVVPTEPAAVTADDLLEFCDGRLAGFKRPKTIGFADELPRTASGTVDREVVRELLRDEGTDVASLE
ncbi:class I adenylate-forming enzyme family protein [Halostagnicola kamekurae]|uniref:O-succinylbenzoic acid--CoA ligase n=1 Tax=Halostagnicola kamekurae TaxID=619731 RepID=A0A1I6QWJ5_9EURY|nr:class I adenylate-forming enzyme family protein [Halostagnicola kamekurae]SFS56816.1 O-succinylbenzoic acid--CoA ligase [Halostagnicola kamekurae]